jgi:hypothetical protein
MSKINKSLVERVQDLESGIQKKSKVSDPNLNLFVDDEWRYKAYRWYCLKNIALKITAIIAGASPVMAGIVEVIRNAMG